MSLPKLFKKMASAIFLLLFKARLGVRTVWSCRYKFVCKICRAGSSMINGGSLNVGPSFGLNIYRLVQVSPSVFAFSAGYVFRIISSRIVAAYALEA